MEEREGLKKMDSLGHAILDIGHGRGYVECGWWRRIDGVGWFWYMLVWEWAGDPPQGREVGVQYLIRGCSWPGKRVTGSSHSMKLHAEHPWIPFMLLGAFGHEHVEQGELKVFHKKLTGQDTWFSRWI